MRRCLLMAFLGLMAMGFTTQTPSRGLVVFVPGTFNAIMPGTVHTNRDYTPYFSRDILHSVRKLGYQVQVIDNLHPTGRLEINGQRVAEQVRHRYAQLSAKMPLATIIMIGHSAGGFYALHALKTLQDLPIKAVVAVATPFGGAKIANAAVSQLPATVLLIKQMQKWLPTFIDLNGLLQMTTHEVDRFLGNVVIPQQTKVYAIAGLQRSTLNLFKQNDARYLAPLFALNDHLIGGTSDGVIRLKSALQTNIPLKNSNGKTIQIQSFQIAMPLGHIEQILDVRWLRLLGFTKWRWIRQRQREFYPHILSHVDP